MRLTAPRSAATPAGKRAAADRLTAPRSAATPATRRDEVLDAALSLVAEHGIAGASLRKLAAELGISQPSLYYYFSSKDELIAQIIEYCADKMLEVGFELPLPRRLKDLPRFAKDATFALWEGERHPHFVRFLFVVAFESKEHRPLIEKVVTERLEPSFERFAEMFTADPEEREFVCQLVRMVVYSLGFPLLQERALLGAPRPSADLLRYAEWVVNSAERMLDARG